MPEPVSESTATPPTGSASSDPRSERESRTDLNPNGHGSALGVTELTISRVIAIISPKKEIEQIMIRSRPSNGSVRVSVKTPRGSKPGDWLDERFIEVRRLDTLGVVPDRDNRWSTTFVVPHNKTCLFESAA